MYTCVEYTSNHQNKFYRFITPLQGQREYQEKFKLLVKKLQTQRPAAGKQIEMTAASSAVREDDHVSLALLEQLHDT